MSEANSPEQSQESCIEPGAQELIESLREDIKASIEAIASTQALEETHAFWDHYSRAYAEEKVNGFIKTADHLASRFDKVDYLEIGSNKGLSMAFISELLRSRGVLGASVSIDPYFDAGYMEHGIRRRIDKRTKAIAYNFYEKRNLQVEHIELPSRAGLSQLIAEQRTFQWVYVDGCHHWLDPMIDWSLSACLTEEKGIIMFDDLSLPDIKPIATFVEKQLPVIYKAPRLLCLEWHNERVFPEACKQTAERLTED